MIRLRGFLRCRSTSTAGSRSRLEEKLRASLDLRRTITRECVPSVGTCGPILERGGALTLEVTKGHLPTTSCQRATVDPIMLLEGPFGPYSPWNLQPRLN